MIRPRPTGTTNDRPRIGRPRVMSQREDKHLRLIHLRNRIITAEDTAHRPPGLANVWNTGQTICRRLGKYWLRARGLVVGPILKHRHMTMRLAWDRARRRWRLHTWQHILFSDYSRVSLRFSDGPYRVYHRHGKRFTEQCVYESDHFGGVSVMVWAGINHDGRTQLKIVQWLIGSMRRRCEAVVSARGGHTRCWTPQASILHDNFCLSMISSDNDVEKFCWYCLICYVHMNLNYTIFLDFFSLCKKYRASNPCIVSFVD
jgi:hypothetical protein